MVCERRRSLLNNLRRRRADRARDRTTGLLVSERHAWTETASGARISADLTIRPRVLSVVTEYLDKRLSSGRSHVSVAHAFREQRIELTSPDGSSPAH